MLFNVRIFLLSLSFALFLHRTGKIFQFFCLIKFQEAYLLFLNLFVILTDRFLALFDIGEH